MNKVQEILDFDLKMRNCIPNDSDLYDLSELNIGNMYNELPILKTNEFLNKPKICLDFEEFKNRFYKKYPILKYFNYENLVIAGSSVANTLIDYNETGYSNRSDIDFFIYGLDEIDAFKRLKLWLSDLGKHALHDYERNIHKKVDDSQKNPDPRNHKTIHDFPNFSESKYFNIVRNNYTITVNYGMENYQIVFRLYNNISQILHGFDLGSSSVAFNGERLFFTKLGKFCFENMCNIVDTTKRSTTYEHRLAKYYKRSFNIVLPSLDIKKLRTNYFKYNLPEVCELPFLKFKYHKLIGNEIVDCTIIEDFDKEKKKVKKSDYKLDLTAGEIDSCYELSFELTRRNLFEILKKIRGFETNDFYYHAITVVEPKKIKDIISTPPLIDKNIIVRIYNVLFNKSMNQNKLNISSIRKYITEDSIENIIGEIMNNDDLYLKNLKERQMKVVFDKIDELENRNWKIINWVKQNPGTQICGSYNPIIEDESKWYGDYYLEKK